MKYCQCPCHPHVGNLATHKVRGLKRPIMGSLSPILLEYEFDTPLCEPCAYAWESDEFTGQTFINAVLA